MTLSQTLNVYVWLGLPSHILAIFHEEIVPGHQFLHSESQNKKTYGTDLNLTHILLPSPAKPS